MFQCVRRPGELVTIRRDVARTDWVTVLVPRTFCLGIFLVRYMADVLQMLISLAKLRPAARALVEMTRSWRGCPSGLNDIVGCFHAVGDNRTHLENSASRHVRIPNWRVDL